ncbi:hypothetical protein HUW51_12165 [Adhaeribacter swui]|uniref:DUF4279 domain-containing protein n=1 Tax=Adhaeribacter swui TaxID=2086471 RepID=A0A7G7G8F3_9BACT|nr:DUF4279 domain-containing protein [Adhaeribacter swui]QNF33437.1 hypothetical protein HUW51_12165 [Adhaeribacter swui]
MCVLRISGQNLNVEKLILLIDQKPVSIYRKGEPYLKSKPNGRKNKTSGINYNVSNASFDDLEKQIKDAIKFIKKYKAQIAEVTFDELVDGSTLDFGIDLRIGYQNVAIQADSFPSELLKLLGELNIDLGFTLYPPDLENQIEARADKKDK